MYAGQRARSAIFDTEFGPMVQGKRNGLTDETVCSFGTGV